MKPAVSTINTEEYVMMITIWERLKDGNQIKTQIQNQKVSQQCSVLHRNMKPGHVLKREWQYFGHSYVLHVEWGMGKKDGEGKKREGF